MRHTPGDNDWSLAIKFVNQRDQGVYVCQVSTNTGSLSHYYNLAIIVPRAYILGADEYYAMAGGDISLVCIIEDVSHENSNDGDDNEDDDILDPGASPVCVLVS